MKLSLHFYLLNDNFSPEYAEAQHGGEESENNPRFEWEDELEIDHLAEISLLRNSTIFLRGYLPDETAFSHEVQNMFVIRLNTTSGQEADLGVSESILDHFNYEEDSDNPVLKVYIKDYEPHGNPMPGVYIASKEFPKDLVF